MAEKIQTLEDLERAVERIGFLPYSGNRRELLFTLEERTDNAWHDDSPSDPWLWRSQVAAEGRLAYGKFFLKRSGFVAPRCLPAFVALRRENRTFSDLYARGLVSRGAKRVYDCFADRAEWTLPALKSEAGFAGASREFEAALTELQGLFFLCISGQTRRVGRTGSPTAGPTTTSAGWRRAFPRRWRRPCARWRPRNTCSTACSARGLSPARRAAPALRRRNFVSIGKLLLFRVGVL